jgi:hypothetical protein
MSEQFNLVKQLADMQSKAINKHTAWAIKRVTFDLSKKPRQTSNKKK